MVMNPIAMLSPEQQKFLTEVQKFTKDIHATVVKRDGNGITVTLTASNPQAEPYLPQIQNALISSIAQMLYTMFNIQGRVEG